MYFYAPKFVVEIKNPFIETARTAFYDTPKKNIVKTTSDFKKIYFKTDDNLLLTANMYFTQKPLIANIILVHGIRSNKEKFLPVINLLTQNGYNAIALDLRAHGASEGQFCTFGYKEKDDISRLITYLHDSQDVKGKIGIWAHSLGSAISLQAMANDDRIQFAVLESPYANYKQIMGDYSSYFLHLDAPFINDFLLSRSGEMADFCPKEINPIDIVNKIQQPILLVHGLDDKKINPKNSQLIYDKLPTNNKELLLIKKASHSNIWQVGGKKYFQKVIGFFNKQTTMIKD